MNLPRFWEHLDIAGTNPVEGPGPLSANPGRSGERRGGVQLHDPLTPFPAAQRRSGTRRLFVPPSRRVFSPVESAIAKWFDRQTSQEVCPWNAKFSRDATEPSLLPIARLATTDALELAREMLAMSPEQFHAGYKHTPLSRAKLAGLARNAGTMLANAKAAVDSASPPARPPSLA